MAPDLFHSAEAGDCCSQRQARRLSYGIARAGPITGSSRLTPSCWSSARRMSETRLRSSWLPSTYSGRMHAIEAHGVGPGLNINELKFTRRNLGCRSQNIPIGQVGGGEDGVIGDRDTIETKLELAGRVDDGVRENRLGQ